MQSRPHAFAGNPLDRAADRRADPAFTAELARSPTSRFLSFVGERPVILVDAEHRRLECHLAGPAEIDGDPAAAVFLGLSGDGSALFARALRDNGAGEPLEALPEGTKLIDLRSLALQGALPPGDLGILAQARSLLGWHAAHRFCARCGAETAPAEGGYKRACPACRAEHFPRTDPVAIILVARGEHCLLGRQARFLPGVYSALAGFIEPGESIEEAARREVFEESGIRVGAIRYHSSQPWPFPSSLMIGLLGEALSSEIKLDPAELEDARWFRRADCRLMLEDRHSAGLKTPAPIAIAHHLIRAFVAER